MAPAFPSDCRSHAAQCTLILAIVLLAIPSPALGFLTATGNQTLIVPGGAVLFSGALTDGDSPSYYVNVFVENASFGGGLPPNGTSSEALSTSSITGVNATFFQVPVIFGTWTYVWDTGNITGGSLLPGSQYRFYFVNESLNASSVFPGTYTRISVGIEGPIIADYALTTNTGTAPLTVTFTDISTGIPTTTNMSFGDGTWANSSFPGPMTHVYTTPGSYQPIIYENNSISTTLGYNITFPAIDVVAPAPSGVAPVIGDNSDNGPPPARQSPTPAPTTPPTPVPTPSPAPATPNQNTLSLTYPLGFDGLDYNTGGSGTLSLSRSRAGAAGADVTVYFDRLEVYQHHSPGVLITFWGDNFTTAQDTITGPVTRAEFVTDPFRPNLSFGQVSVSVHAALESLSGPGAITTTVNDTPPPEITGQYEALAGENGLRMGSVAYTLSVEKDNISRTTPANITMSIPAPWVAANGGKDAVRIGRISKETGIEELLGTTFTGTDPAGNLVFRGDSPNGTSLFGLLTAEATEQEQKAHPNVTYVGVSQSAMVTNAGMAGWLIGLFESNPALLVVVAAVIAALAYFGWWRRRL